MSSNLTDLAPRLSDEQLDRLAQQNQGLGDTFGQGLRSGGYSALSQLNKLAGTSMDAAGLDGSSRNAASVQEQQQATDAGAGLTGLRDVHDVSSGLRYGAGMLGQMAPIAVPAIGAGLLTGGGAVPAMLAGAAATLPFEMGGQLQRQDADPANVNATPQQRLQAAFLPAAGASLVQNIVPGGVAARLAGRGSSELGGLGLRAVGDIAANAAAGSGAEGIRQYGDNTLNPNAGYNPDAIKQAGYEGAAAGAVFAGAGAAGHLAHAAVGGAAGLPGRAIDAAKGMVPDKVSEAAGGAVDIAQQVADWSKGSIAARTADVKAWGKEFMDSPSVDGSVKAQLQDALANPGDKAKQAWLATLKFGEDAKNAAADAASTAAEQADIPTRLRGLYQSAKDNGTALLNKMANGAETADPAAPDQAAAQATADQTTFQKAKQWASELADENLSPENAAKLKEAAGNLTDKVAQQTVATIKRTQDGINSARDAAARFNEAVKGKMAERQAGDPKLSADYSGANKKIGDAVMSVLGPDHPLLQSADGINQLADGLRPFIERVAQGKALDSFESFDALTKLFDATGDQTTDVLAAVHKAVSGASENEKGVYKTLSQIDAIHKGQQDVHETQMKSLKPELADSVRPSELRTEAEMLNKWARDRATDSTAGETEKVAFRDGQVRRALEFRYGDKADAVLAAVEKNFKTEEHAIDLANTRTVEGDKATTTVKHYTNKGGLYLKPELDVGKSGHESAVKQAMARAQLADPGAEIGFRSARELGRTHPLVEDLHRSLVKKALGAKMTPEEARAHADAHLDDYGVVTADAPKSETRLTSKEVASMAIDPKFRDKSKAAIPTKEAVNGKRPEGSVLDGVRIADAMNKKLSAPDDYLEGERPGSPARMARMFKEGIAALTDHFGHKIDVPDSTVISRDGTTWGDVKKADRVVAREKAEAADKKATHPEVTAEKFLESERLQAALEDAKRIRLESKRDGITQDMSERAETGAIHDKSREKVRNLHNDEQIKQDAKDRELSAETDYHRGDEDGRVDPLGNVHEALGGKYEPKSEQNIRTNNDGSARADTVMGRRKPATSVHDTGAPPDPKVRAAKQAAFTEKARSGDEATLKAVRESNDPKGLQRAVDHLNTLKDVHDPKVDNMIAEINGRIAQLVQQPGVALGMQTKKYSLLSTQVHEDLGRGGFAATHDSPIKHEGKFDWRTHAMKGEGAMVKGAGTYLSTADAVHSYYKKQFTDVVQTADGERSRLEKSVANLKDDLDAFGLTDAARAELQSKLTAARGELAAYRPANSELSPTYHLSVDIKPDELMHWDKPVADQPHLQAVFEKAVKEFGLTDYENGRTPPLPDTVRASDFYKELSLALAKDDEHAGDRAASDWLQANGILGHEMKASSKDGIAKPNYVIYDDSKIATNYVHFSQERTDPNATQTSAVRAEIAAHIDKVLGPDVAVKWTNILHAGEFDRTATKDIIRLSIHALDPRTVAFHESLHGLFARLSDAKQTHISDVLAKAGESEHVLNQLKALLKNEPDALKQLTDREERAAYMYQFWAEGKLTVGPQVRSVFQKIAQFIREVTGMLSNDERAEKIMNYFHSGEYEANRGDPNAVHRTLMDNKGSAAVEAVKAFTKPLQHVGEALATAGGARLRDTGIPALRELADAMKLKTTSEGRDAGFVPAARAGRSRVMNQIGADLKPYGKEAIAEALEAMQNGTKATSLAARTVAKIVGRHLEDQLQYMKGAGVRIDALGMKDGVPYFPRSWDASYISGHQREFLAMLQKYKASGELKGDPRNVMRTLMVTDGAEFNVEVDKPGMQNAKERTLAFISHADAATFMRKNMYEILNGYVTQSTRRAEWAKRFGDDGKGITRLIDTAKKQGATPEQLDAAAKFVRAVDGTLGDGINPTTRRLMGNMLVYQNLRLLPLAIFSSAVDSQGIIVRGGSVGDAFKTFKRGMTEVTKSFKKDPKSDRMTELAETLGVVDSAMLVHTLGASYSQGMVGNKGRAINDTFFRLNLMEQYNTSMRVGATEAAMNFLVKHSQNPGDHSVRFLRELGLDASDVQLDGNGRPKLLQSDGLSLEHSAKMKAAVNRWVDGAILRPDAVDKPVWMSDPNYALIAHLKQFVFSFHETILKRVAAEAKQGNYSPAMALAGYVPVMIAADMLKGLIQGGGSQPNWKDNWGLGDYVWSGMERAGLFGVGQFGIDVAANVHEGGSGIGALVGPTLEQFGDAAQTLGGREQFKTFAVKSLPANALYASALKQQATDPQFAD